jgi:hypothetical protein
MSILIHLSDLHFGPSYIPKLGETILNDIKTIYPDVVVISGDLTLRARHNEFLRAKEYLDRISKPTLVIPGNHDQVIFNPIERLVSPLARYRKQISPQIDSSLDANGFFVIGLNDNRPILPGGSGRAHSASGSNASLHAPRAGPRASSCPIISSNGTDGSRQVSGIRRARSNFWLAAALSWC